MDIRTSVSTLYGDWFEKYEGLWRRQIDLLKERFSDGIEEVLFPKQDATDVPIVYVKKDRLVEILKFLKSDDQFEYAFLSDLTATDESPKELRFEVVYQIFSHKRGSRLRVKVRLKEDEQIPSIVGVWEGANWGEREVWDMFGIKFFGHPDLRRILMDERWEGFPLRKDYPLRKYQIFPSSQDVDPGLLS